MTDRTNSMSKAYVDGRSPGDSSSREESFQTLALCHIAEMLTSIAYDIRALRESADQKSTP